MKTDGAFHDLKNGLIFAMLRNILPIMFEDPSAVRSAGHPAGSGPPLGHAPGAIRPVSEKTESGRLVRKSLTKHGGAPVEVSVENRGPVRTIILNRPGSRNAVNRETADRLAGAFRTFEKDESASVAVLYGAGGHFCAGADLKAISEGLAESVNRLDEDMSLDGPMGPSRMTLSKPVIAAISGYAVAGGLELACWCDLRVAERNAILGVFCRRFGVPLIDGGTLRLPRLIGLSRALDLILTGRPVDAEEALAMGLVNRVVENGEARRAAETLASQIAAHPQVCMRSDRESAHRGCDLPLGEAMALEFQMGMRVIRSGETVTGARQFSGGRGKHGKF